MIRALVFDCFGVFYSDPVLACMHDSHTSPDKAKLLQALDEQATHGILTKIGFIEQAAMLLNCPTDQIEQQFFYSNNRNQALIGFIKKARKDYKIALLSNIGSDMMDGFFMPAERKELFDVVILSGDVKMAKPDQEIFELICRQLGVPLREAVMIDNVQDNINAAKSLGMQVICYKSIEQFKIEFNSLLTHS